METIERFTWGELLCTILTIWGGWLWFFAVFGLVFYVMDLNHITGRWRYLFPLSIGLAIVLLIWILC